MTFPRHDFHYAKFRPGQIYFDFQIIGKVTLLSVPFHHSISFVLSFLLYFSFKLWDFIHYLTRFKHSEISPCPYIDSYICVE